MHDYFYDYVIVRCRRAEPAMAHGHTSQYALISKFQCHQAKCSKVFKSAGDRLPARLPAQPHAAVRNRWHCPDAFNAERRTSNMFVRTCL